MNEKFKQILKSNAIIDPVSEVIIQDAGLRGEGFASLTQCVTVKFEDSNKKQLNLFVKVETGSPSHKQWLDEMKAFEKEARFLSEYVVAAQEMCKLKGLPDFLDFYPKCYYADEKMIVLENLVMDKSYQTKDKDEGQNMEFAKFSLETLAKHHAIGHVMITEKGGPKKFFERFPNLDHEAFDVPSTIALVGNMMNSTVESGMKILEKFPHISGALETIEKLKHFVGKPMSILAETLKNPDRPDDPNFLVLGHGDYWNNNMMFILDGPTQKVKHQVAIDFQITRYNTPALDLTHYLYTSVQPHLRRSHLLELLNIYKNTLNKVTEDFGHPINLTLDQIFKDFRKKIGYGFWTGFMMSVVPSVALFKDVDISKADVSEWPALLDKMVVDWIEENPENAKKTAIEIVDVVKEYEQLEI